MGYYPLFLKLESMKVLLAGAGRVGRRKAASLLEAGVGELLWLDPEVSLQELAECPEVDGLISAQISPLASAANQHCRLNYERRAVAAADIDGCNLVFAATGSRETNAALAAASLERDVLCNVIDAPGEGNFIVPAHFRQGDILVALATGGQSPALSRRLRIEMQAWVGDRYAPLLALLGRLRPLVLELACAIEPSGSPSLAESSERGGLRPRKDGHERLKEPEAQSGEGWAVDNAGLFRSLVDSELGNALADGDLHRARAVLLKYLPEALHPRIGDILYEPV